MTAITINMQISIFTIPVNFPNQPFANIEHMPVIQINNNKDSKKGNLYLLGKMKKSVAIK